MHDVFSAEDMTHDHDTIRSAVHGYDRSSISKLAQRTFMLADAWK